MLDKNTNKRLLQLALLAGGLIWLVLTFTTKDEIIAEVELTHFKECTAEELKNYEISSTECTRLLADTFQYCAKQLRGTNDSFLPEDFVDFEIAKLNRCRTADLNRRITRESMLGNLE